MSTFDGVHDFDMARNPLRSSFDRLDAWNRYEALQWAIAHMHRHLPMSALPKHYDYCCSMGDRIDAILEAHIDFRAIRKSSPAAHAGTS